MTYQCIMAPKACIIPSYVLNTGHACNAALQCRQSPWQKSPAHLSDATFRLNNETKPFPESNIISKS